MEGGTVVHACEIADLQAQVSGERLLDIKALWQHRERSTSGKLYVLNRPKRTELGYPDQPPLPALAGAS